MNLYGRISEKLFILSTARPLYQNHSLHASDNTSIDTPIKGKYPYLACWSYFMTSRQLRAWMMPAAAISGVARSESDTHTLNIPASM